MSGVGRELGLHGLHEYTELKSVNYSGGFTAAEAGSCAKQASSQAPVAAAAAAAEGAGFFGFGSGFLIGGALASALVAVVLIRPGCPA